MFKNIKAFTLTEMIIVIAIIWILMAWTTVYLQWSDDTRKIIEAQWCASTIWWTINNYIFYSLTSKNLRISDNETDSPDLYAIKLTDCNGDHLCDSLEFYDYICDDINCSSYSQWAYDRTYNISDTCHTTQSKIKVKREWSVNNISEIKMNKWFTRTKKANSNIFYIQDWENTKLIWEIILVVCIDDNCSITKEVSKRVVDWRTQTISLKNCGIYKEDDKYKCEEREN